MTEAFVVLWHFNPRGVHMVTYILYVGPEWYKIKKYKTNVTLIYYFVSFVCQD